MATWITHLIIADSVMKQYAQLDRRGFCVGNIAPDCNIPNEDWSSFTPSREITHWMTAERKIASDCDLFYDEYIKKHLNEIQSHEEYSYLLGYYAHLIVDAEFQRYIRDTHRVAAVWTRIDANDNLQKRAKGYPRDWDTVKNLIPYQDRLHEIYSMEAEYLRDNPTSGYITEILPLKEFPDYIDYLPHGCIVYKIGLMGYIPEIDDNLINPISLSREEFSSFIDHTTSLVISKLNEKNLALSF